MQFDWNFLFSRFYQEKKKKSSYRTTVITIWVWFVKHGWNFANNLYIKNETMYNFVIKITMDEVYYVKCYCQAWLWWKILYSLFFFGSLYCMLYTQLYNFCILIRV